MKESSQWLVIEEFGVKMRPSGLKLIFFDKTHRVWLKIDEFWVGNCPSELEFRKFDKSLLLAA